jgi:signal transduction histidine kinase
MGFPRYRSALIFASFITVASFIGVTAYTEYRLGRLDSFSSTIESNAGPSLEYLGRAGLRLRRLLQLLGDGLPGQRLHTESVTNARRELLALEEDITRYLSLTPLPGEAELWRTLRDDIGRATELARSTLEAEEDGDGENARRLLREAEPAFDRAGRTILTTLEFDGNEVETLAREVRDVRRDTLRTMVMLDALATAIAVGAAFVADRAAREHQRLLEAHNTLLSTRVTELDRFAGRMAHDVLSPLDTVAIGLSLIARHADAEAAPHIDRTRRALQRVKQLVDGLLTFARSAATPNANVSCALSEVLANVAADAADAAHEKDIALVVEPHAEMNVACSAAVLTSILQNLVQNAIRYMGERHIRRVSVRASALNSRVRLEVEDSGPGIPDELHSIMFEPFARGQHGTNDGVGLGLATVKRLTEAHGGHVGLHSRVGVGTVFHVELPLADGSHPGTARPDRGSGSSAESRRHPVPS